MVKVDSLAVTDRISSISLPLCVLFVHFMQLTLEIYGETNTEDVLGWCYVKIRITTVI
jgi:hypothetical protein